MKEIKEWGLWRCCKLLLMLLWVNVVSLDWKDIREFGLGRRETKENGLFWCWMKESKSGPPKEMGRGYFLLRHLLL